MRAAEFRARSAAQQQLQREQPATMQMTGAQAPAVANMQQQPGVAAPHQAGPPQTGQIQSQGPQQQQAPPVAQ